MGDDNVELANLLVTMQSRLLTEIHAAKDVLVHQIDEVKDEQAETSRRLEVVEQRQTTQQQEIADLRTVVEERTGGIGLTKTQKAALWTAVSGVAIEALRHLSTLFSAIWMFVKTGGIRS